MGVECILFSFAAGLVPLFYGFHAIIGGNVFLTSWSRVPIRGVRARLLGLLCVVLVVAYYAVAVWAWSKYDR
jgi:hypothetical protein